MSKIATIRNDQSHKNTKHPHQKTTKIHHLKPPKHHLKHTPKSDKKDVNPNPKAADQRQAETLNFN